MFCCVVGWQFVNTFDLKYTRELLQRGAVLHTCRCETLQMQSECVEADGFSHGLAEADVNQAMVINLFRLAQFNSFDCVWGNNCIQGSGSKRDGILS